MTEQVKGIRNEVIHKFCRTVLWIDDEIHLDTGLASGGTNPLFKDKFDEFTRSKLLCHMMGFPEVRSGTDPFAPQQEVGEVLNSCVSLALQSDVVIVDWMLGSTDSSEYAEEIIRELLGKDKGHRIIVVLSQQEPAESSLKGLSFESETETLWKNGEGQFLLSLRKDEFKNANLFEEICKALLTAYPDYLHLTALEIAGRIKDVTPQWLSRIPSSADIGVLVERGNTFDEESWNEGIQECIATNLLEDLSCVVRIKKLDTLNTESLKPSNSTVYERLVAFNASDSNLKQAVSALKECVKDDAPQPFKKGNYEIVSDNRGNREATPFVEGIEAFAEFCEKRSGRDWEGYKACPGAVYGGLSDGAQSIAVCITSGCDCLRADSLLFLIGEPIPVKDSSGVTVPDYKALRKIKGGKTVLRINGISYVFKSSAESVLKRKRSDIESLKIQALVRQDVLNRLIGRYMSHTQRFGVNQPDIVRAIRDEGGFE